jgi:hypothetical protein
MKIKNPWLKRIVIVMVWTSILYIGYQLTNQHQYFETRHLPLTVVDNNIPFMAWTVIPYFVLIGGMYLPIFIQNEKLFFQSLIALTIAVLINYTIFFFWPTVIERPPVPIGNSISEQLYRWLLSIDGPANCFPSGHITSPGIGIWYLTRDKPQRKLIYFPLYALFALSVLTTKQHYIWDIMGGLASMTIGILITSKWQLQDKFFPRNS